MARVAYAEESDNPDLARRIREQRGGKMLNLYRMLMNSPPVAEGWLHLLTAIRQQCLVPALYTELAIMRVAVINDAPYEFAAHLPFYPAAHLRMEEARWSPAPIRVLHGDVDDYTPAHFASEFAEELRPLGVHIEVTRYANGHHSFDSIEPLAWLPKALRLGKRTTTVGRDGRSFTAARDGTKRYVDEPSQRAASFAAAGNRGAHVGGSWEARRTVFADAADFFAQQLLR